MTEIKSKYIPVKISFGECYELLYLLNSKDEKVVELVRDTVTSAVRDDMLSMLEKYDVANTVPNDVFWHTVEAAVANIVKYYDELYVSKYGKRTKKRSEYK